jgi:hypothetical protein
VLEHDNIIIQRDQEVGRLQGRPAGFSKRWWAEDEIRKVRLPTNELHQTLKPHPMRIAIHLQPLKSKDTSGAGLGLVDL